MSANNSFLSQFHGDGQKEKIVAMAPKAAEKPSNQRIKAPDHLVVEDKGFHKRKIVKMGIIGAAAIVVAILGFFMFRMARSVEVMDFTGQTWSQATQWGLQNGISLQRQDAYNLEFDEDVVFGQNAEFGSSIQRGSVLVLEVSQGADMNEVLVLPDFEDMSFAQTNTWRTQMRAVSAIATREIPHADIPAGQFIEMDYGTNVDLDHFTRRDNLTLYFSSGPRTLTMPNFMGRNREEVEEWAEENALTIEFVEVVDELAEAGEVLEQNIEPRTRFTDEEIVITVASGEAVIIPNFANLSLDEIMAMEDIRVTVLNRFHPTVAFGRLIEQSIPAGTEVTGEIPRVTVYLSLGRPFLDSLIGQNEGGLARFFHETFVAQGANITFGVQHVDSYEPRGSVVWQSQYGTFVGMNAHIYIHISRGNRERPSEEPAMPEWTPPPASEPESEWTAPEPEPEAGYPYHAENGYDGNGGDGYDY